MLRREVSAILPKDIIRNVENGFDIVGDIAIVKFSGEIPLKYKRIVAKKLMDENKHINSVFEKFGKTEGQERIPRLKWIIGKRSGVTLHHENGCVFKVDIRKVFYTSRLSNERLRVINQVKPNEIVLDMFAGVGPYSIPIAKRAAKVYSIDINKVSVDLLKENIKLNNLNNVEAFHGDALKVVPKFNEKFDRIIMNFPLRSEDFLGVAVKSLKEHGKIHFYHFVNMRGDSDLNEKINMIKSFFRHKVTIEYFRCGEIAPNISRICFDISS